MLSRWEKGPLIQIFIKLRSLNFAQPVNGTYYIDLKRPHDKFRSRFISSFNHDIVFIDQTFIVDVHFYKHKDEIRKKVFDFYLNKLEGVNSFPIAKFSQDISKAISKSQTNFEVKYISKICGPVELSFLVGMDTKISNKLFISEFAFKQKNEFSTESDSSNEYHERVLQLIQEEVNEKKKNINNASFKILGNSGLSLRLIKFLLTNSGILPVKDFLILTISQAIGILDDNEAEVLIYYFCSIVIISSFLLNHDYLQNESFEEIEKKLFELFISIIDILQNKFHDKNKEALLDWLIDQGSGEYCQRTFELILFFLSKKNHYHEYPLYHSVYRYYINEKGEIDYRIMRNLIK